MSYRVGVDIGGTFTDMVVLDERTGELSIAKSPTTPRAPIEGVLNAIRKLEIDPREVAYFVHGTTAATNAVVQRRGAKVGLITTHGFRDTLEIMRCHREFHYDLQWVKPKPLVPRRLRVEVPERIDYKGRVIRPLDEGSARAAVRKLRAHGVEAVAVCFLFSFVNPAHERRMKEIIREEWPEVYVSTSSEILPEVREYERTSTVVIDAYVKPLINHYFNSLERGLDEMGFRSDLMIMTSGGGVVTSAAAKEMPVYTLSSGPAGGVIGSVYLGQAIKERNLISMDMGGTSFDVSLVDGGQPRHTTEGEIEWGVPFRVPLIDVRSIGAGGGSIAWIDQGGLLRVGPQSAGAEPGPVCYGRGGEEPTVTDAYVALGIIDPEYFLGGELKLDKAAAEEAIGRRVASSMRMKLQEAAQGILDIAQANMVGALHIVSIQQGYDPRDFTLLAYGGASPVSASALAKELGIKKVVVPVFPGAFSALGMLTADIRFDYVRSYLARFDEVDMAKIAAIYAEMERQGAEALRREGFKGKPALIRSADLRYVGQNFEVATPVPGGRPLKAGDLKTIIANFNREHERQYAHSKLDEPIEFVSLRLASLGATEKPRLKRMGGGDARRALKGRRPVYVKERGRFIGCPIYERTLLPAGVKLRGPAIVEEVDSTIFIGPRQVAEVDRFANVIINV